MIKVRVPATSANMGPGFDAIGIALNLYNEIEVYPSDRPLHFEWEEEGDRLPSEKNLTEQTMRAVFQKHGFALPHVSVYVRKCHIPIQRGLGSSSAAIVSGLALAYEMMGEDFDKKKLAQEACLIEGHPDNVIPAIEGGMSVTVLKEGKPPLTSHIEVPEDLRFIAVIPPYEICTEQSRAALPVEYRRSDCIGNAARTALLVNAMVKRDYGLLRTAFEDFVHQPYRLPLMQDAKYIFELFQENRALGEFISGSGSTLIGVFTESESQKAFKVIEKVVQEIDPKFRTYLLNVDTEGMILEHNSAVK